MSGIQMALLGSGKKLVKQVAIITAGTSVTLPSSWNPANNTIEVIGGGKGGRDGGGGMAGAAGGGGSYAKISNFGSPSTSYTISVGQGSLDAYPTVSNGGNTWFSSTGVAPTSISEGVLAAGGGYTSSIGTTTFSGGNGGGNTNGGGGAAGPNGNGLSASGTSGGQGDASFGGAGGTAGNNGSNGSEWTATSNTITGTGIALLSPSTTAGSGGGGGGDGGLFNGAGGGGNYGAGGGGGNWYNPDPSPTNGGQGTNGIIVLTWYA